LEVKRVIDSTSALLGAEALGQNELMVVVVSAVLIHAVACLEIFAP